MEPMWLSLPMSAIGKRVRPFRVERWRSSGSALPSLQSVLAATSGHTPEKLLDHLVRAAEERWRNGKTQRLGGFEVDHQFELGRLLHTKICRLGAFQDLVGEDGCAPERVGNAGPVRHEAATVHVLPGCARPFVTVEKARSRSSARYTSTD